VKIYFSLLFSCCWHWSSWNCVYGWEKRFFPLYFIIQGIPMYTHDSLFSKNLQSSLYQSPFSHTIREGKMYFWKDNGKTLNAIKFFGGMLRNSSYSSLVERALTHAKQVCVVQCIDGWPSSKISQFHPLSSVYCWLWDGKWTRWNWNMIRRNGLHNEFRMSPLPPHQVVWCIRVSVT
jgi:hypothetical protein